MLFFLGQELHRGVVEDRLENLLVSRLRQRSERDHLLGKAVGDLGDLVSRHDLRDQANAVGLLRVDEPGRQEDVRGVTGTDKPDEPTHLVVAYQYAQPGHGDAEPAVVSGDADVGRRRELASTAHTDPLMSEIVGLDMASTASIAPSNASE